MVNQFGDVVEPWINGQTVLEYYGINDTPKWRFVGFTSLFFIFFYVVTLLVLQFKRYQVR